MSRQFFVFFKKVKFLANLRCHERGDEALHRRDGGAVWPVHPARGNSATLASSSKSANREPVSRVWLSSSWTPRMPLSGMRHVIQSVGVLRVSASAVADQFRRRICGNQRNRRICRPQRGTGIRLASPRRVTCGDTANLRPSPGSFSMPARGLRWWALRADGKE